MAALAEENRELKTQTGQITSRLETLDDIKSTVDQLEKRAKAADEDERTAARELKKAASGEQWGAWFREVVDARTVAIILAILAGFAGVQLTEPSPAPPASSAAPAPRNVPGATPQP